MDPQDRRLHAKTSSRMQFAAKPPNPFPVRTAMSIEISRITRCWVGLVAIAFAWILTLGTSTQAQIVQIPSMGTFNISSSASVPDQGSAFLGGNRTAAGSSARRAVGRDRSSASVSASTTVIDLDELDRMIRSQAFKVSAEPKLKQFDPKGYSRLPAKGLGRPAPAEYDYLAALSGDSPDQPHVSGYGSVLHETGNEATSYYLNLANLARQRGHWASVETYYLLAWKSLPQSRRDLALRSLEKSRAESSKERLLDKDQAPSGRATSKNSASAR